MLDDRDREQSVKSLITELCEVLDRHGIETVSLGAMMRLLGIDDQRAQDYDREWIYLGEQRHEIVARPPDQKLH